ncbi:MAG: hypothetical protein JO257_19205 [Deltaproteobacteria bacterium]|nr:hypothetical protein [Deltaproteobacteria bacterium]
MSTPQNLSPEELASVAGGLTTKDLFKLQRLVSHVDDSQQQQQNQTQMLMFGLLAARMRQG